MTRRLLALACLSIAFATPVSAQTPAAPATARTAAQESYAKGIRFFNQAEQKHDPALYEAAYLQFAQAYAIFQDDRVLWNLAVCEVKTGRLVDGLTHLRAYEKRQQVLAQPKHPDRAMLLALLEQAAKATGHIAIEAPDGAHIRVDGKDVGTSPLAEPLDVMPGAHAIDADVAGRALHADVTLSAGESRRVSLALPADRPTTAPVAAPAASTTVINTTTTPVPRDAATSTSFFTTRNSVALGLGLVAVGSLAIGIGFRVAGNSDQDHANQLGAQIPGGANSCGPGTPLTACQDFKSATTSAHSEKSIATGFFITSGIAAAGVAGVLIFWPSNRAPPTGVVPMVSPTTAGVQWMSAF